MKITPKDLIEQIRIQAMTILRLNNEIEILNNEIITRKEMMNNYARMCEGYREMNNKYKEMIDYYQQPQIHIDHKINVK